MLEKSRNKSLLDFFEMEWKDWAESVPFLRDQGREARGVTPTGKEVSISKVSANYTYPNVFGLRRHKLGIMKQIVEAVPRNVKFVRLNDIERSPEMFIQGLVREFDLTVRDGYEPQPPSKVAHTTGKNRRGFPFRVRVRHSRAIFPSCWHKHSHARRPAAASRPSEQVCLTPAEWDAAQNSIDWKIESEFGFGPFECRMCHGYETSKSLYNRVKGMKKVKELVDVKQEVTKRRKRRGG